MNEKDTLLIVLGDSWSAGVGSADAYIANKYEKEFKNSKLSISNFVISKLKQGGEFVYDIREFEYTHSWPTLVCELRNWDIKNLAQGGSGNNGMNYRFLRHLSSICQSKYKHKIVIQLVSGYDRLDYITENRIVNLFSQQRELCDGCKTLRVDRTGEVETVYHMISTFNICKKFGFDYYWFNAFNNPSIIMGQELMTLFEINKHFLDIGYLNIAEFLQSKNNNDLFSDDGHPSMLGYELIANLVNEKLPL